MKAKSNLRKVGEDSEMEGEEEGRRKKRMGRRSP